MKEKLKVPKLRFKGFLEEWEEKNIDSIFDKVSNPVDVQENEIYNQIGIRSHGKGIFYKEGVTGKELGNKRVFWIEPNVFIVNIVFAWERAIAKTTDKEIGLIASHRFPMYKPKEGILNLEFITSFFKTDKGQSKLELASPGGAGRNKTLGQKEFSNLKLIIPKFVDEQQKIADFLSKVDEKIVKLTKKKELLEGYKKGIMQKIFSQELRFKDDNGNDFPEWEEKELGDCLDYIQPTNYIVKSTEYDNKYDIPVLTAGKSFILGYTNEEFGIFENPLPVIIFDDFTTSSHFVDFRFKVKSSAMKILTIKGDNNIKYIYEAMKDVKYVVGGHERHWISKYSFLIIQIPSLDEQQKIADFISALDKKIDIVDKGLRQVQEFKKGLLQQMFV